MTRTNKISLAIGLILVSTPAFAFGTILVAFVLGAEFAATVAGIALAFAINMVASVVLAKSAYRANLGTGASEDPAGSTSLNPGNRVQVPAATDNKISVVYGEAWVGGTLIDLSITGDSQTMYYVLALCEVTNAGSDQITFGDVYYDGKRCVFGTNGAVDSLVDESTGVVDTSCGGKISIFLFNHGSNNPTNTTQTAVQIMQSAGLIYTWDSNKLMTDTAFAIVKLTFSDTANIRALQSTKFKVINSRSAPGDCFTDYLTDHTYGAAIDESQIDYTSFTALNTYSAQNFNYTTYNGIATSQTRFRFDGVLDTKRTIMSNLQDMATCCDCLLKFNEVSGQWGVIVQSDTYTVALALNDSNMVSAISISPLDISSSFNIIECKFPDKAIQDSFNTTTYDLTQVNPGLLYPNEPVNKQSVALALVNDSVRAQYIANRLLKAGREDLLVQVTVDFSGIQLEAGDVVSITSGNYQWNAKLFRVNKIVEQFDETGAVTAQLSLAEFNPSVFSDVSITQFTPSPNGGLGDPLSFGAIPAPVIASGNQYPTAAEPYFMVGVTTPAGGVTQYAEIWYSAFATPTSSQLIFVGNSEIRPSGAPYPKNTGPGTTDGIPLISVTGVPRGNWFFFARMVNSLGNSAFSPASSILYWRPMTIQFSDRYLAVAYATSLTGTGFSLNPRNKTFFGLRNQTTTAITASDDPATFKWYPADPAFGTANYLVYVNRQSRRFSFDTGVAQYAAANARFVPADSSKFDARLWSGLPDGTNTIDLDLSTGQILSLGTTSSSSGQLNITNNSAGGLVASLDQFLTFNGGATEYTSSVATLTVDIYGRVKAFAPPDNFYYTNQQFQVSTATQSVFTVTRDSTYVSGQCFVFRNGVFLDASEFTDTAGATGTVTLATAAVNGDIIQIVSMRAYNATTGGYAPVTRYTADLTAATSYTATGFTLKSGNELLFLNGTIVNENDYNIVGQQITDFPNPVTGRLVIVMFKDANTGQAVGGINNVVSNPIIGQATYLFDFNAATFNLFSNGVLYYRGAGFDYQTGTGSYTLNNLASVTPFPDSIIPVLVNQRFTRFGVA
jgi:hypothetical protein